MENNVKKYRNYEKTEQAIKDALVQLCNEKKYVNKVTVKELCELANISKSTFYLHYADIESIFESVGDKFKTTFEVMFLELVASKITDFSFYIKQIISFINESSELIKIGLTSGNSVNYYIKGIKDQLERTVTNSVYFQESKFDQKQILAEVKVVTSGIIDYIIELLRKNDFAALDEHASYINNFLTRWVMSFGPY